MCCKFYAFFSFLNRRTDFYCIMPDPVPGGRMGFKEGQAEQILLASFRQFPLRKINPPKGSTAAGNGDDRAVVVKAKGSTSSLEGNQTSLNKNVPKKEVPSVEKKPAKVSADNVSKHPSDNEKNKVNIDDTTTAAATKPAAKGISPKSDTIRYTDEGKQIPIGNGGSTSRYVWTQTLEEVTVHIPLPEGIRAKDLDVKIGTNSLSICQKGEKNTSSESTNVIPPIEGTLFAKIRPSESTWTLESSKQKITTLQLILDKYQKTWWSIVLSGDTPLIDTTMVDSTRHIDTYDDKTQAEIRRIMHDQRQERLGLPTSSDEMLKDLPPMPTGEKVSLPAGVEYIDGETLDKATISDNEMIDKVGGK